MPYVDVAGVKFYFEAVGEGVPILLIPPSGATASTWGELVGHLAEFGRAITYDRRGYARTGGGVVHAASVHTSDAAAILEALAPTPAVVVGTSAGATIAIDLAVRRPDLVGAVVAHEAAWRALLHPAPSALGALARMEWLAAHGRYAEAAEALLRKVYAYRDGGSAWDAFPEDWRRVARDHGECVVADLHSTLRSYPRARDLGGITVPVLCTYGSRSPTFMRDVTGALARAIPTAVVRKVPGSAHAVPFDAPTAFAELIVEAAARADRRPHVYG